MLGAVQGLTEFIPISSSGHLVLVPAALGWADPGLPFDVLLHVASLLALFAYFGRELVEVARGMRSGDRAARRLVLLLALGTIPAVVAGVTLSGYFDRSFADARGAAVQLVITAVILVAAEQGLAFNQRRALSAHRSLHTMEEIGPAGAGLIGVAQAISILPGISRSGATIGAGMALSVARDDAARFSFLLAVPALLGAALVKLPELGTGRPVGAVAGAAGFAASLVCSYLAIAGLIRYLRTRTLYPFALYCVVAGVVFYLLV